MGGWHDRKYVEKKERLYVLDEGDGVVQIGGHGGIRDVMPDCVLNLVRGLYPNPPGQSYMGHKWI